MGGGGDVNRVQVNRSLLYLIPKPTSSRNLDFGLALNTNRCEMIESYLLLGYINPLQCISKER